MLTGTLTLVEAPLVLTPAPATPTVLGRRIDRLPGVRIELVTDGDELIPVERGPIAAEGGTSYWGLLPGVGRVGEGLAELPFALLHPLENETHHGVLRWPLAGGQVDVEVVQCTAPYLAGQPFQARGTASATFVAGERAATRAAVQRRRDELAQRYPRRPWSELARWCEPALLDGVDATFADSAIVHALLVDDVLYAQPCRTPGGDSPFPAELAFGVWSVTKSAFAMLSALRLTHSLGEDVGRLRVGDLVAIEAGHDGWDAVTIADCLDMATGIGDAGPEPEPADAMADYGQELASGAPSAVRYHEWVTAPSRAAKLASAFACPRYPWGPGRYARYRDQDLFMAGVAMDALLRRRRGAEAGLWPTMRDEVYAPIGIGGLTLTHTVEPGGGAGVPVTAFGLVADLDALAKIARLLQRGGRTSEGEQLLDPAWTAAVLGHGGPAPRPTGRRTAEGEYGYRNAFWYAPYRSRSGSQHRVPCMTGYGGNFVVVMPNGTVGLRIARDPPERDDEWDPTTLMRIAERIRPFER